MATAIPSQLPRYSPGHGAINYTQNIMAGGNPADHVMESGQPVSSRGGIIKRPGMAYPWQWGYACPVVSRTFQFV
ncbi:hypothetical protein [Nitrosomonas sp. ANs5]|uniref:hypothetical protein n=1 Tax=Nitrosomonas sp. ANs5 TaxID=3423941 RepID=UPI003D3473F7